MKIVFFNESATLSGGVERVVCLWANYFAKRNAEVTILNVYGEGSFYELDGRVSVKTLDIKTPPQGLKKMSRYIRIILALRKYLKKQQPDYFISNSAALACSSLCANRFGASKDTKIIVCDHNTFYSLGKLWSQIRKALYRHAYAVISLTQTELPKYQMIGAHAIHIPNPLPWGIQDQAKKNTKVALAVGRFTRQKGFDLLLEAWKTVSQKYPDWMLEIVGGGEDEEKLLSLRTLLGLEKSVKFISSKSNIQENYLNASVFIASSRYEGLPMVLIEAKSFGLPCVSFDCETGPNEIIRDGVDGYLARPEDPDDLAEKIVNLISDPQKIMKFGENAFEDASRFSQKHIMELWEEKLIRPV